MSTGSEIELNQISAEEIASHNIRANHELISDLSESRRAIDQLNDDFPGVNAIITSSGRILRANRGLSELLHVNEEDLIDHSLEILFTKVSWQIILAQMAAKKDEKTFSLDMPVDRIDDSKIYHWIFAKFSGVSTRRGLIWSVQGSDISAAREAERRLATVFSTIPVGLLTLDRSGQIEWPYSAYCEVLLGRDNLSQLSLEEGLFGKSQEVMQPGETEKIRFVRGVLGQDEDLFQMMKSQLPLEVPISLNDGGVGWRKFSYSPVLKDGLVDKLLIIIEDITSVVNDRQKNAGNQSKESKVANLIVDLQALDPELIDLFIEDIDNYFRTIEEIVSTGGGIKKFCSVLHGIKGVARTVNLRFFKEFVHEMESRLLKESDALEGQQDPRLLAEFASLRNEWADVRNYGMLMRRSSDNAADSHEDTSNVKTAVDLNILESKKQMILEQFGKYIGNNNQSKSPLKINADEIFALQNMIRSLGYVEVSNLADRLNLICSSTAKKLGKSVRLDLKFGGLEVPAHWLPKLLEVFLHIITNGIDHGIEAAEVRKERGKSETGVITIEFAKDKDNVLSCTMRDDGKGIDVAVVRSVAIKKNIITEQDELSNAQLMNLILDPGFSTTTKVTDISGRGMGLFAAVSVIEELKPIEGLHVSSSVVGAGTVFSFKVRT